MTKMLNPIFEETERFLKMLDPNGIKFTFQTFADLPNLDKAERKRRTRILHGTLAELFNDLTQLNFIGASINVVINATDFKGRKETNITSLRAAFIDSDHGDINEFIIPPSITIKSKGGTHAYYLLKPNEPLDLFRQVQRTLSDHFNTDPKVCDLPRVMRLPGFFHMKEPNDPFMVKITRVNETRYTIAEILEAYVKPEVHSEK